MSRLVACCHRSQDFKIFMRNKSNGCRKNLRNLSLNFAPSRSLRLIENPQRSRFPAKASRSTPRARNNKLFTEETLVSRALAMSS